MSELTYNEFKDFFLAPINEFKDAEKMKGGVYVNGEVVKTIIGAKPKPALLKELEAYL